MTSHDNRSKRTGTYIVLALVLLFGTFTLYNVLQNPQDAVTSPAEERLPVTVVPAGRQSLAHVLEQTGNVQPWQMVNVYSKVPGKIIEDILVEKGDTVHRGDPIAILERDVIDAQLAEARAGLASAEAGRGQIEANLKVLEKDRARMENLLRDRAVARQKVEHIQAQEEAARKQRQLALAQIEMARASIRQLNVLSANHRITAPIDGIVAQRFLDVGNITAPGVPLFHLMDDRKVKIITTVTEKDWPAIHGGMAAEVTVAAYPGKVFTGRVALVSPVVDPATRTAEVELHIDNNARQLAAGMFANVRLVMGERDALTVPADALQRMPGTGQPYVYVVETEKAVLRNVTVGQTQGTLVEVIQGLTAGEAVVVKGYHRLREGSPVQRMKPAGDGDKGRRRHNP